MSPNWKKKSKPKRKHTFVMRILRTIRWVLWGRKWEIRIRIWSQDLAFLCHVLEKPLSLSLLLTEKWKTALLHICKWTLFEFLAWFPLGVNLSLWIQENEIVGYSQFSKIVLEELTSIAEKVVHDKMSWCQSMLQSFSNFPTHSNYFLISFVVAISKFLATIKNKSK